MDKNIKKLEEDLDNFRSVQYRMDNEGIGYCFDGYSDWDEICLLYTSDAADE